MGRNPMHRACDESFTSPVDGTELPFGARFVEKLLENLYDGVYFVDCDRRILYWNKGAERISGYSADAVIGRYCHDNLLDHSDGTGYHLCQNDCPLVESMCRRRPMAARVFLRHRDGRRIPVDVHTMPAIDEQGRMMGGVQIFRDASPAVALEATLEEMRGLAEQDPLTGLANRRHLDLFLGLQQELVRRIGAPFSIIMADLDHFKDINDNWGHQAGDKALVAFSQLLRRHCRGGDVPGRWGGDEFLIILPGSRLAQASAVAERMRAAAPSASPPDLDGRKVTASFGVAEAGQDRSVEELIRDADAALYAAKAGGRDRVCA
jgi:diguanylate cyclase (GGDEF)-like protein/PAS domain S-box-containing protein